MRTRLTAPSALPFLPFSSQRTVCNTAVSIVAIHSRIELSMARQLSALRNDETVQTAAELRFRDTVVSFARDVRIAISAAEEKAGALVLQYRFRGLPSEDENYDPAAAGIDAANIRVAADADAVLASMAVASSLIEKLVESTARARVPLGHPTAEDHAAWWRTFLSRNPVLAVAVTAMQRSGSGVEVVSVTGAAPNPARANLHASPLIVGRMNVAGLALARLNLHALVTEDTCGARSALGISATHRGITVTVEVIGGAPAEIISDQRHLRVVLQSLFECSLKLCPRGGHVECRVSSIGWSHVSVVAERRGVSTVTVASMPFVRIAFMDDGVGLTPEVVDKIFAASTAAPTFVYEQPADIPFASLALAQLAAETLGGALGSRSEEGVGTLLVSSSAGCGGLDAACGVALPRARAPARPRARAPARPRARAPARPRARAPARRAQAHAPLRTHAPARARAPARPHDCP